MANLPKADRDGLCSVAKVNPDAVMLYVNKLYALKTARLAVKEGSEIHTKGNVDNPVISAGAAWDFSNSQEKAQDMNNLAINITGIKILPSAGGVGCDLNGPLNVVDSHHELLLPSKVLKSDQK